jgi:hypothetical protein
MAHGLELDVAAGEWGVDLILSSDEEIRNAA